MGMFSKDRVAARRARFGLPATPDWQAIAVGTAVAYVVASEMAPHRQQAQPVQQPQPQPVQPQQRATFYDQAAPVRGERYDHAVMRLRAQH